MSRSEADVIAVANKTLGGENVSPTTRWVGKERGRGEWSEGREDALRWRIDKDGRATRLSFRSGESGKGKIFPLPSYPLEKPEREEEGRKDLREGGTGEEKGEKVGLGRASNEAKDPSLGLRLEHIY